MYSIWKSRSAGNFASRGLWLAFLALFAAVSLALAMSNLAQPAHAAAGEVVILDTTVTGGAGSTLASKFTAAGKTPVLKTAVEWAAMTAAEFDSYDGVVLGDPTCSGLGPADAAEANAAVWSSVVDGNVIVIGTDETYHQGQGGDQLMEKAAAFSVAEAGKTGAYISLSCYYHGTDPLTPVPLLSGFGTFTATGVGCYNDSHITATHPALAGLTDVTLSNWSCSVHEAFDSWPLSFEVLAIAEGIGASYTAPDGTVGTPYILARGVDVISDITLSPEAATNPVGTSHTVTAKVVEDEPIAVIEGPSAAATIPVVGTTVTFTVIDGPHMGTTGTGVTNAAGEATFSYVGATLGVDTIEATFVDRFERTQRSNRVTKTWVLTPVPVIVPTVPPIVIDAVGPTARVSGKFSRCSKTTVAVLARVSDASGVQEVRFYVDGKLVKTDRKAAFSAKLKVSRLSAGSHTLKMVAVDAKGNTTTIKRKFKRCARVTRHIQPRLTG